MRLIKLGILSVVVLFGLITAMSMLLPSQVIISRAIDINKPLDSVYHAVTDLTRWQGWMDNYDPAATSFSMPAKGKGAYIKMGKVRVDITSIDANKMDGTWQIHFLQKVVEEFLEMISVYLFHLHQSDHL